MRNLRILAAVGFAGLALVATGCGGDDEPSIEDITSIESTTTDGTSALSKDEVIAQGDAICAEGNAAINSLAIGTDRALAADQVRSITDGMRGGLRALDAPAEDRDALNDLIGALGDQVSALEDRAATARAGDEAGYEAAGVALETARASARTAGEAYGFASCGQPFDAAPSDTGPDSGGIEPDTPTTPETPVEPPPSAGGGTGAPTDGGGGGGTGDGTGGGDGGGSSGSGGISPG